MLQSVWVIPSAVKFLHDWHMCSYSLTRVFLCPNLLANLVDIPHQPSHVFTLCLKYVPSYKLVYAYNSWLDSTATLPSTYRKFTLHIEYRSCKMWALREVWGCQSYNQLFMLWMVYQYEAYLFQIHMELKINAYLLIIFYFYVQGELIPFKSYLQRYATPYAASQSSSPLWYAVRRASAHIIVLSSYSPFGKLLPEHMHLFWFLGKREC